MRLEVKRAFFFSFSLVYWDCTRSNLRRTPAEGFGGEGYHVVVVLPSHLPEDTGSVYAVNEMSDEGTR